MIELGETVVLSDFPPHFMTNLKSLMLKALTKHTFVELIPTGKIYPVTGKEIYRIVRHPQTEGQLMGSIISFPFLCIANAAICRMSMEVANRTTLRLTDKPYPGSGPIAPMLINGDDCVLKGLEHRLRTCWESIALVAGLESSVGKTYFSNNFITINSTIFNYEGQHGWKEQRYINLGLMMGRKRNGKGDNHGFKPQLDTHELGTICRELKRSCPPDLWSDVKKRFIYYNGNALKQFPNIPWFVPEWLGGIGLPCDDHEEISELDRRVCTYLKMNMNTNRKLKPCKPKEASEYKMHQLVMKQLRCYDYLGTPNYRQVNSEGRLVELQTEFSRLYKYLTINFLFTKRLFGDLSTQVGAEGNVRKAMFHNSDLWAMAGKHAFQHEAMSDEDMMHENKDLVLPCVIEGTATDFEIFGGRIGDD